MEKLKKQTETGDGPVDAIFKCVKKLYPHDVKLQLYQVHAGNRRNRCSSYSQCKN